MYKHTCLQMWDLCTKSYCHAYSPNGCFVLSVIYSQNIHLPALTKSPIFYYPAAQQSPNSCVLSILLIIFLTALRLHSGESSQNSERSPAQAESMQCFHVRTHAHAPLRTDTHAHTQTLPDTSSPVSLIAGDSSHCEKQCSPSLVLCCYYISSSDFIPFSLSSILHLSALYRFVPSSTYLPPSVPAPVPLRLLWFSAYSVYSPSQRQKPGKL